MCRTQCLLALVALYVGLAHSWDIAVGVGNQLIFYTDDGTKTNTVNLISRNVTALAYDEVHKRILYVDKQSIYDAICSFNLYSKENTCFLKRTGSSIHSIAFDPATQTLFFTDTYDNSINWISLKPGSVNNVNANLLIKMDDRTPNDIAVDSCRGYIYWTNTNNFDNYDESVERARFDGSGREIIKRKYEGYGVLTLIIDPLTRKMYYFDGDGYLHPSEFLNQADLNGQNEQALYCDSNTQHDLPAKELTVSKGYLYWVYRNESYNTVWQLAMINQEVKKISTFYTEKPVAIATNYKIEDQMRGLQDCAALLSLIPTITRTEHFCVNGVHGDTSVCNCTPGYFGERCEVSVCHNYCLQGNCRLNDEGLPACSCNPGYTGERCEFSACCEYCLNNGTCSLNDNSEPVCECNGGYVGDRCEVSHCLNYCIQGNCSVDDDGLPSCSCNAGYTGERCDVNVCSGYCSNNGTCSLNENSEPVCECNGGYVGDRCEVSHCLNYCSQGNCSVDDDGLPACSCHAGFTGERCDVNVCSGYCLYNGTCSLNENSEPVCECNGGYVGDRCEVSHCLNYCIQGNCSFNETRIPTCRCNAGYLGDRCEVYACGGYCLNDGACSLNEEDEPVCQCAANHEGSRCEAVKDVTFTINNTPTYYSAERNLTLADLLGRWRKPSAKVTVTVEV